MAILNMGHAPYDQIIAKTRSQLCERVCVEWTNNEHVCPVSELHTTEEIGRGRLETQRVTSAPYDFGMPSDFSLHQCA